MVSTHYNFLLSTHHTYSYSRTSRHFCITDECKIKLSWYFLKYRGTSLQFHIALLLYSIKHEVCICVIFLQYTDFSDFSEIAILFIIKQLADTYDYTIRVYRFIFANIYMH